MYDDTHVMYDHNKGAWIILNNSPALAQEVKNFHPNDVVLLFDIKTGEYERYYVEYDSFRPEMKNGKIVNEPEKCKI